jgi:DNA-binding GntR family transcriptional regulator
MTVLKSKNLAFEIADLLREKIVHCELKAGERILEAKIAKELSVSQSSVREALRVLEQCGLVEINQRRGTFVTELSNKDIEIMYDIVTELYAILIIKAMEQRSTENVAKILDVLKRLETSAEKCDVDNYHKNIFEFAYIALDAVKSSILTKIISDLWPNKQRVEYMTLKARKNDLKSNVKYFKLLEKYMLEGNLDKLVKTIREYTQSEKKFALSILASGSRN